MSGNGVAKKQVLGITSSQRAPGCTDTGCSGGFESLSH